MAATAADNSFEEWKETRTIIGRYDDNLHDLRKYGFSFVAALLAANGLLSQGSSGYALPIKATVLVATLTVLVALRLLDKHYRLFQEAASVRGRMLENRLNIDITTDISVFFDQGKWWGYVQALYFAFVAVAALVGVAILYPSVTLVYFVLLASWGAFVLIGVIEVQVPHAWADWSVDKKEVTLGDPVRITLTNLNSNDKKDPVDDRNSIREKFHFSWSIAPEEGTTTPTPVAKLEGQTGPLCFLEDRNWLWTTSPETGVWYGLYRLTMETYSLQEAERKHVVTMLIQVVKAPPLATTPK